MLELQCGADSTVAPWFRQYFWPHGPRLFVQICCKRVADNSQRERETLCTLSARRLSFALWTSRVFRNHSCN